MSINETIKKTTGDKIIQVTLVRSPSGNNKRIKSTLEALGLTWVGRSRQHVVNMPVLGMVKKVNHLVRVSLLS
jgi:ribosomal protein L30